MKNREDQLKDYQIKKPQKVKPEDEPEIIKKINRVNENMRKRNSDVPVFLGPSHDASLLEAIS